MSASLLHCLYRILCIFESEVGLLVDDGGSGYRMNEERREEGRGRTWNLEGQTEIRVKARAANGLINPTVSRSKMLS